MIWTDEHVSTLRNLVANGKTLSEIAAELGVGRGAISGKMERLRLRSMNPQHRHARKKEKPVVEKVARPKKRRQLIVFPKKPKPWPEPTPPQPYTGPAQTIIEVLLSGGCKFAVTPHDTHEHLFCGAPRHDDRPYCAQHCLVAFNYETRRASAESLTRMVKSFERMAS